MAKSSPKEANSAKGMVPPQVVLAYLGVIALATVLLCPLVGFHRVTMVDILAGAHSPLGRIYWDIRVPRVAFGFIAGGALAVGGMVFQAMFRNALATPYTLGVASGASFGAALAFWSGISAGFWGVGASIGFSLVGSFGAIFLVCLLAPPNRGFATTHMLLAGVMLNFLFSSLLLMLQYLSDYAEVFQITRWLMGSLDVVSLKSLLGVVFLVGTGLAVVLCLRRDLDVISLGEELAYSRGLNANRARLILFIATSVMVGGIVSVAGPIGFVGLVVPHIARHFVGASHRWLFWASLLGGGSFLVLCDTVARTIIAPAEMPVGIITAIVGGPFFLAILARRGLA